MSSIYTCRICGRKIKSDSHLTIHYCSGEDKEKCLEIQEEKMERERLSYRGKHDERNKRRNKPREIPEWLNPQ